MASRKERLAFCFDELGRLFAGEKGCGDTGKISEKDAILIYALKDSPKMMSELAESLGLTPGTMTTRIDSLIKKKYVIRKQDPEDRRKVYITLTKKGEKISEIVNEQHQIIAQAMLKTLESTEQEQLVQLLEKITTSL